MTCCTHTCNQGRDCPFRNTRPDEYPVNRLRANVWRAIGALVTVAWVAIAIGGFQL